MPQEVWLGGVVELAYPAEAHPRRGDFQDELDGPFQLAAQEEEELRGAARAIRVGLRF